MWNCKKCKTCIFRSVESAIYDCDYSMKTGHTRMAEDPEKCSYYKKGPALASGASWNEEKGTTEKRGRKSRYDWDLAWKLYRNGFTDGEIRDRLGCKLNTVSDWRQRNKLPPNYGPGEKPGRKAADWDLARKMLKEGALDEEVAVAVGVKPHTVKTWRSQHNIKSNRSKGRRTKYDWDLAKKLHQKGRTDVEIAEALDTHVNQVRTWRARQGLPPNKKGGA